MLSENMRPTRNILLRILDAVITLYLWAWYGVADRVRLCFACRKETQGDFVSIIMPTIGRDLTKAVESVLAQTHKNWELIIVGDGVKISTPLVIAHSLVNEKVRVSWIPKKIHYPTDNPKYQWLAGPCRAINYGLSRVRGVWIARIDDDDVWHPRHLEDALKAAKMFNVEFVSFPIDLNGRTPEPDVHWGAKIGAVQSWLYRSYLNCFKTNLHCWRKSWNANNDVELGRRMARAGVKILYYRDYAHARIVPRPGLTEVGLKGWLEERKGESYAGGQDISGRDTGEGREQGNPEQER